MFMPVVHDSRACSLYPGLGLHNVYDSRLGFWKQFIVQSLQVWDFGKIEVLLIADI